MSHVDWYRWKVAVHKCVEVSTMWRKGPLLKNIVSTWKMLFKCISFVPIVNINLHGAGYRIYISQILLTSSLLPSSSRGLTLTTLPCVKDLLWFCPLECQKSCGYFWAHSLCRTKMAHPLVANCAPRNNFPRYGFAHASRRWPWRVVWKCRVHYVTIPLSTIIPVPVRLVIRNIHQQSRRDRIMVLESVLFHLNCVSHQYHG